MGAPGFWDEPETAQKTAQAVTQLKEEVETFRSLETRVEDMEVLCELALEEDDEVCYLKWKKRWLLFVLMLNI